MKKFKTFCLRFQTRREAITWPPTLVSPSLPPRLIYTVENARHRRAQDSAPLIDVSRGIPRPRDLDRLRVGGEIREESDFG